MNRIKLDALHVRWHPDSPIPRAIYDGLLYGDSLDSLYQTLWTWATTDDKAAELKTKMLDLCTSQSWQPIQVVQEGTRFFIVSGELDALAAMHAGEESIACTWKNGRAPATPPADEAARPLPDQAERPVRPAPPPPDAARALDHQIADFAGWLHARPQPSGHVLAASAAHLVAEIGRALSPDDVWDLLFADRYSRMPTGWQPTPKQVHRAAVKHLAREARTSEYTVNTLLRVAQLPQPVRERTLELSFSKLERLVRLYDPSVQLEVAALLQRRPLTFRQLTRLVSLCNRGMSVEEAIVEIDAMEASARKRSLLEISMDLIRELDEIQAKRTALTPRERNVLGKLAVQIQQAIQQRQEKQD